MHPRGACFRFHVPWHILPDLDEPDAQQDTLLSYAVKNGHLDSVKCLVELGASVDQPASLANLTPLLSAVKAGHIDIATVLLDKGADPNACDMQGQTLLVHACALGDVALIQRLVDLDATSAFS